MTDRHRFVVVVAFTGGLALSAGACIQTSKADSKPADRGAAATPGLPPGPAPRIHGCTTRFAIRAGPRAKRFVRTATGDGKPMEGSPVDPGGKGEEAGQRLPTSRETARKTARTGKRCSAFLCLRMDSAKAPEPKDFLSLLRDGTGMRPVHGHGDDRSVPPAELKSLFEAFQRQARGLAETSGVAIGARDAQTGRGHPWSPDDRRRRRNAVRLGQTRHLGPRFCRQPRDGNSRVRT